MIVKNDTVQLDFLKEGLCRKILARGGKMMAVEVQFKKNTIAEVHSHPHEQIGFILKGRFELEIEDTKEILYEGDTYYVPPDVLHGVVALEDAVLLDVFTPQRDDFFPK